MCFQESVYLVNSPLSFPSACGDFGGFGGRRARAPSLLFHQRLHLSHQPVLFMKYNCPTRDVAISMPQRDGRKLSIQVEAYFM